MNLNTKNNYIITICIVNYNSADFIINTLYCLEKITKNPYKIIIRDNNSKFKDFKKLKKAVLNYKNVFLYRIENFRYIGSKAHGIAINDLVKRIDTPYGVILDADCTFLYKNWDEILINELSENTPIIGTQAPIGYGSKKYTDFPLMFAVLFDTNILKKLNIDFKPSDDMITKDTGYQMREAYLKAGYKGKLLIFKNTRDYKKGPFKDILCGEYYLNGKEHIFASHFSRGSTLGKAKYLKTKIGRIINLIPIIGDYLLKLKGKREKKKWIKTCKQIVNQ
ncbi:MAG: glycosyltransferase [Promethearchaeia archaeon]